ncbi:hypothetical protein M2101_002230 [Parabacteroides sp. PM5-20]|uniref:DUF3575 domain-containing protein n=1 Tax=unclassified Parabacteroides TaxID=2649774 RepID=UPI0013D294AF|nr:MULTISPECIES: DUF3575 domain-containing protein [unclassified Parabacteroides]MDH6535545.1 hypothetical protein [Parabacteroides sp. PM5-20]
MEVSLNIETDKEFAPDSTLAKTVRIYFRVNRANVERDYMDNADALDVIDQVFVGNLLDNDDFIVITGKASPEGNWKNNQRLATERALALKNYIQQKYTSIKDNQIVIFPGGEDWDGLLERVENDTDIPGREELLQLLRSDLNRENQKVRMQTINNGKTYAYLLTHILPYLRGNVSGTIYSKKEVIETIKTDTVELLRIDTVFIEREVVRIDTVYPKDTIPYRKPFVMAFKNNMIYDLGLLPNLSVEIPFGRNYRWSVAIEGNWSWWDTGASKYNYHRIQMAGLELRHWFGNKKGNPLNGWYVGAYGYGGDYDIRLFAKKNSDVGQQSLWTYSGGLTFGYAVPIGRRLNLEFGIGAGYIGGKYKKYDVSDCAEGVFPILGSYERSYFGLTKGGISLVWQIGNRPNIKNRKGATR